MLIFGYDEAPEGHFEVVYDNVRLDLDRGVVGGRANLGRGFEVGPDSTTGNTRDRWLTVLDHTSSTWAGETTSLYADNWGCGARVKLAHAPSDGPSEADIWEAAARAR